MSVSLCTLAFLREDIHKKAKIEKWFRTLKDQWMSQLNMNDFENLDELRTSIISYVNTYNQNIHSSLNGLSPQDRFFNE